MQKLIAVAVLVAFATAPAALAKERNIALTGKPSATTAGKAWNATVSITVDDQLSTGAAPTIRLLKSSSSVTRARAVNVVTSATSTSGVYQARVSFPSAGTWRVVVVDRMTSRAYSFGVTRVRAPTGRSVP